MKNCCPTCGQSVPTNGMLVDLDLNRVSHNGKVAKLVPSECELLVTLLRGAPGLVSNERAAVALWGAFSAERSNNVIKVHISRLRQKLTPLGIQIETHWGRGYSLRGDEEMLRDAKRQATRRRAA